MSIIRTYYDAMIAECTRIADGEMDLSGLFAAVDHLTPGSTRFPPGPVKDAWMGVVDCVLASRGAVTPSVVRAIETLAASCYAS